MISEERTHLQNFLAFCGVYKGSSNALSPAFKESEIKIEKIVLKLLVVAYQKNYWVVGREAGTLIMPSQTAENFQPSSSENVENFEPEVLKC